MGDWPRPYSGEVWGGDFCLVAGIPCDEQWVALLGPCPHDGEAWGGDFCLVAGIPCDEQWGTGLTLTTMRRETGTFVLLRESHAMSNGEHSWGQSLPVPGMAGTGLALVTLVEWGKGFDLAASLLRWCVLVQKRCLVWNAMQLALGCIVLSCCSYPLQCQRSWNCPQRRPASRYQVTLGGKDGVPILLGDDLGFHM